jgi:hypothetical protein
MISAEGVANGTCHGAENAEEEGVSQVEYTLVRQRAGGYQDGLTRPRPPALSSIITPKNTAR